MLPIPALVINSDVLANIVSHLHELIHSEVCHVHYGMISVLLKTFVKDGTVTTLAVVTLRYFP